MKREDYISWDEYFMGIAMLAARRSKDPNTQVGACIVSQDNIILSTGYNGTPRGVRNCFDDGCPRCSGHAPSGTGLDECLCVHAEQNAICQAARYGINVSDATIYVTISPCLTCAKLIINAGIREVVYGGDYTAFVETVKELFRSAGVTCRAFGR